LKPQIKFLNLWLIYLFIFFTNFKITLFSGTLKFHGPSSSIVLESSRSKLAIVPDTVAGWPGRSIYTNDGKVTNIKTASNFNGDTLLSNNGTTELITANSNSIVTQDKQIKYNSNSIIQHDKEISWNSSFIISQAANFISINNGKLAVFGAINGATSVPTTAFINSPINLRDSTLTLSGDLHLSSDSVITSSGKLNLNGFSIILTAQLIYEIAH